jgi:hypothetical protein
VDLYEHYLLPVMSILDTTGPFRAVTQQIAALCAQVATREATVGLSLVDEARRLRQQVTWLRRTVLRQADEANAELAPLCMTAARESAIARGVNRAIQAIQEHKWAALSLGTLLEVVGDPDSGIAGDRAIESFMRDAYTLREQRPPRIAPTEPDSLTLPVSAATLRERLDGLDSVDDLLAWVVTECESRSDADVSVNLLFALIEMDDDRFHANGTTKRYEYDKVTVDAHEWSWRRGNG